MDPLIELRTRLAEVADELDNFEIDGPGRRGPLQRIGRRGRRHHGRHRDARGTGRGPCPCP